LFESYYNRVLRITNICILQALADCINCLPGQKDVDEAIYAIESNLSKMDRGHFPHTSKSYSQLQKELDSRAENLNLASSDVVTSVQSPVKLATSAQKFNSAVSDLMDVGLEMAGQTKDTDARGMMVVSLKNVTIVSSQLLTTAKSVSSDPNAPNSHSRLTAAARLVDGIK
jgi:talin